jgi:hypothetical protein
MAAQLHETFGYGANAHGDLLFGSRGPMAEQVAATFCVVVEIVFRPFI